MLPAALEYPSGDSNGLPVYRPSREGRSYEHLGEYKTIDRIPLYICLPVLWSDQAASVDILKIG